MTRRPPGHEYNAAQPGFTLEELKEIDNNLEATAEAVKEEAEGWRIYY